MTLCACALIHIPIRTNPSFSLSSQTTTRRLESTSYTEMEKVAADVKLTFDNAILYNPPGQEIHKV